MKDVARVRGWCGAVNLVERYIIDMQEAGMEEKEQLVKRP